MVVFWKRKDIYFIGFGVVEMEISFQQKDAAGLKSLRH
jgi:hypothetical protein